MKFLRNLEGKMKIFKQLKLGPYSHVINNQYEYILLDLYENEISNMAASTTRNHILSKNHHFCRLVSWYSMNQFSIYKRCQNRLQTCKLQCVVFFDRLIRQRHFWGSPHRFQVTITRKQSISLYVSKKKKCVSHQFITS